MATTHTIGKLTGSSQSLTLEVWVYDDGLPPADLDADDVVTHINGAGDIPTSVLGVPNDGDPQLTQVSQTLWKVGIRYRIPSLRALHPPDSSERRSGFNFHLPRRFIKWAPEVAVYGSTLSMGGFVNVVPNAHGGNSVGTWLEPPTANLTDNYSVLRSSVTSSFLRTVAAIIHGGYVNSTSLTAGAYLAGEVMIVYMIGVPISDTLFGIDLGWSWKENVTDEVRGSITGIDYDGQDFVWEFEEPNLNRSAIAVEKTLKAVIVNQVRPRIDISAIGLSPP